MQSPKEILEGAKTLCADFWKENNDSGYGAIDENGDLICCCVVGAIVAASYGDEPLQSLSPWSIERDQQHKAVMTAANVYASCVSDGQRDYGFIFGWNDEIATKEDVLQGFDCAISKVET